MLWYNTFSLEVEKMEKIGAIVSMVIARAIRARLSPHLS